MQRLFVLAIFIMLFTSLFVFPVSAQLDQKQIQVNAKVEPYAVIIKDGDIEADNWYKGEIAFEEGNKGVFTGKPGETRWADDVIITIQTNTNAQVKFEASDPVHESTGVQMPNMHYEIRQYMPSTANDHIFEENGFTTFNLTSPGEDYMYGVFAQATIPNEFWNVNSGNYSGTITVTVIK